MSTDRELADKIVASKGFEKYAGDVDKSKVQAAAHGVRKPTPSNLEAQVAWELYLRGATVPAPPEPTSPLAEVFRHDAVFTEGGLSNFAGLVRDRALALGWKAAYIQLLHTGYTAANEQELARPEWVPWIKVGWGTYGQGSDPYQDGLAAAAICRRIPALKGWRANGEAWAEKEGSWATGAFLKGWQDGGAPVPLGWSVLSSDTANYARSFAYGQALVAPGSDIDIQVYGADHPGLTVGAGLGMLAKANVPVDRTTMSFSVTGDGQGPFSDYRTWPGPRRLWRPDRATVATFEALKR